MTPGEIILSHDYILLNEKRKSVQLEVLNTSDRPIAVGSHYHFFEVNRALEFDRNKAFGMKLDIASGNTVRFMPGEKRTVSLVEFGGTKEIYGFNLLTQGCASDAKIKKSAAKKAVDSGFKGARQI